MSMTLRIGLYRDGTCEHVPHDHAELFHRAEELDELAQELQVIPLTNFYDHSLVEAEFSIDEDWGDAEASRSASPESTTSLRSRSP